MSAKVNPGGSPPLSFKATIGIPVAVTKKDPGEPATKVALLLLVIAGARVIFRVKI